MYGREDEMEKATIAFLREHDPHFVKRNKNKLMEYPYLSRRQMRTRCVKKELPESALSNRQRGLVPKLAGFIKEE